MYQHNGCHQDNDDWLVIHLHISFDALFRSISLAILSFSWIHLNIFSWRILSSRIFSSMIINISPLCDSSIGYSSCVWEDMCSLGQFCVCVEWPPDPQNRFSVLLNSFKPNDFLKEVFPVIFSWPYIRTVKTPSKASPCFWCSIWPPIHPFVSVAVGTSELKHMLIQSQAIHLPYAPHLMAYCLFCCFPLHAILSSMSPINDSIFHISTNCIAIRTIRIMSVYEGMCMTD